MLKLNTEGAAVMDITETITDMITGMKEKEGTGTNGNEDAGKKREDVVNTNGADTTAIVIMKIITEDTK
ncbi:MAG: hypothetical protein HGB36_09820 [Chlorobiaceae bacterium]|jgi:hypothetical protein|nr:hypothetical protein [Chlorobiaceae bacterium]